MNSLMCSLQPKCYNIPLVGQIGQEALIVIILAMLLSALIYKGASREIKKNNDE